MGYLTPPTPYTGAGSSSFGFGMNNPQVDPAGIRRPTGRVQTGGGAGGGGIATAYSTSALGPLPKPATSGRGYGSSAGRPMRPDRSLAKSNQKTKDYPTYNEPGIPSLRDLGDLERYTGEKWAPSVDYESSLVDTGALIDATDALLKERMGGEMSEAARRFGQMGALQSGGGLGGGYVGTLGESERGYRRDYGEMAHRYRFQAEQADEERRARAHEGAMGRELSAHEGYESKRQRDIEMANRYGLDVWDRETAFDWDKYGAELGASGREQEDAIQMLKDIYGG